MSTERERADRRFEQALERTGARDPRDFYRQQLRELKEHDEQAFAEALRYYEDRLVPAVAAEQSDPIDEWLEYGRFLAQRFAEGETVQVDPDGRRHPYRRPVPHDHLVLHLPASARERALPVGIPSELSPAQRAAYALLVKHETG